MSLNIIQKLEITNIYLQKLQKTKDC